MFQFLANDSHNLVPKKDHFHGDEIGIPRLNFVVEYILYTKCIQ